MPKSCPSARQPRPSGRWPAAWSSCMRLCVLLREGDLYLGFAGNVLALLLHENTVEAYPPLGDPPSRALGTMLNVDLRYGHASLAGTTIAILAASPAPGWSAAVPSGLANLSLRSIAERMAQQNASRPGPTGGLIVRFSPEPSVGKSASTARRLPFLPQKRDAQSAPPLASGKTQAPFILHTQTKERLEKQKPAAAAVSITAPGEGKVRFLSRKYSQPPGGNAAGPKAKR